MALTKEQITERMLSKRLVNERRHSKSRKLRESRMTNESRRSRRKGGSKLRRLAKIGSVKRKIAETKRCYSRMVGKRYGESLKQHPIDFILAANEVALALGSPDTARFLIENTNPDLTSTKIGVFTMDVMEKIDSKPNVGAALIDAVVIDESTSVFFFENAQAVGESNIQRVLAEFGEVTIIAKPGDSIDDETQSDMYMVALTPEKDALEGVEVSEEFTYDEDGHPVLSEDDTLEEDEADAIFSDPAFTEIKRLAVSH